MSDELLDSLNTLIVRVTIGSDTLDIFYSKFNSLLSSNYGEAELKSILSLIVINGLAPDREAIDGLDDWADHFGIKLPVVILDNDSDIEEEKDVQEQKNDFSRTNVTVSSEISESEKLPKAATGKIDPAGSHMAFSMSDEKEIKAIVVPEGAIKFDWQSQAIAIMRDFGFNSEDAVISKRLENIIVAKLKDVRDDLETLDSLTRGRKVGGMELPKGQADRLLALIKGKPAKQASYIKQESKPSQPVADRPIASPKIEIENGLPVVRLPDDLILSPQKTVQTIKENFPAPETVGQKLKEILPDVKIKEERLEKIVEPVIEKVKSRQLPNPAPFVSSDAAKSLPAIPSLKNPSRPTVDGIKFSKQLFGPIEELASMTLIEFRRLSSDASQAVAKIKEKIEVLSKEGFDRRHEAINAWYQSEVSRFYRLLGQASMSEGKGVDVIISERLLSGKPTLSIEEFEAVMNLNRDLRY